MTRRRLSAIIGHARKSAEEQPAVEPVARTPASRGGAGQTRPETGQMWEKRPSHNPKTFHLSRSI
jgi:hypothetical protein